VSAATRRESVMALAFASVLSVMILLSSCSSPPAVPLSRLSSVDEGTEIRALGLLVDLWVRDDGSERLVLAEPQARAMLTVICSPGVREQPSAYARIGDQLEVTGELFHARSTPTIYVRSDDVRMLRPSESVLTVGILASDWRLFEGDEMRIRGFLQKDWLTGGYRLFDSSKEHGIALEYGGEDIAPLLGHEVLIEGVLRFDTSSMSLVIIIHSISLPD